MTAAVPILGNIGGEPPKLLLPKKTPMSLSAQYDEVIVEGLLRRTELLLLGGAAKKMKSWTMLDLLYCIINGFKWLKFPCHKGIVIHFDLELHEAGLRERLELIHQSYCEAGYSGTLDGFYCVPLRNYPFGQADLPLIAEQVEKDLYTLLSIDPIYRLLLGKGESDPVAVCDLLTKFHSMANALGCAIGLIQHFPKGDQSEKDAIDRFSGSSIWGRFPDSLITFTAHQKENCSSVNFMVRSFTQIEPFVVRWDFPRYRIDDQLDPADLKTKNAGRPPKFSVEQICNVLEADQSMSWTEWFAKCKKLFGIGETSFRYKVNAAKQSKFVFLNTDNRYELTHQYITKNGQ